MSHKCFSPYPIFVPFGLTNPASTAFIDMRAAEAQHKGIIKRHIQYGVPYEQISPHLKHAVLAAQDATFFSREGVDFGKLLNYVEMNWKKKELTNQGGTTLTQQLAKNLYSSPSENQFFKLRELFIVQQLETELSKHRIFEIYLNVIEWGDGIWGAEAAARMYFRIPASKLNREQAALLAAAIANSRLPANPSKRLLCRQQFILDRTDNVELPYP
ncbi:transglycosylase domain-containing protein [Nitrosomonas communis]|uniref:transglycosylase domain-containing protein n=1 Tax=Nitrosomonas communis TaxID=44574 RepID=UPI003D2A4008